jgi:hypothetical protein
MLIAFNAAQTIVNATQPRSAESTALLFKIEERARRAAHDTGACVRRRAK